MKKLQLLPILALFLLAAPLYSQEKEASDLLYEAIYCEEITGDLDKAETLLNKILADCTDKRIECAQALYHLGLITEKKAGNSKVRTGLVPVHSKAESYYVRLIENYPEAGEYASLARNRISKLHDAKTFIDPRDGHKYKYVKIGNQTWMAENLAYMPHVNPPKKQEFGIWVYDYDGHDVAEAKATENYQKYGCLYDWTTAMDIDQKYLEKEWGGDPENHQGICPPGWHIPTDQELMHLEVAAGYSKAEVANVEPYSFSYRMESGKENTGTILKSTKGWLSGGNGTDSLGFSVIPGGKRERDATNGFSFKDIGLNATLWTASVHQDAYEDCPDNLSFLRSFSNLNHLNSLDEKATKSINARNFGHSVRCVKNRPDQDKDPDYLIFVKESVSSEDGIPTSENIEQLHPQIKKLYDPEGDRGMWVMEETKDLIVTYDTKKRLLIAYNKEDNSISWESANPVSNNSISKHDNKLYFSTAKQIISISAKTGETIWAYDLQGISEVHVHDGKLFGKKNYRSISRLDINTGQELWNFKPKSNNMVTEPIVEGDILVFGIMKFGLDDSNKETPIFYGLNAITGEELWRFSSTGGTTINKPTINNGIVYFNNRVDKYFCAIDINTGQLVWKLFLDKIINSDIEVYKN